MTEHGERGRRRRRRILWGGGIAVVLAVVSFVAFGANRPADPYLADQVGVDQPGADNAGRTPVEGFGEIGFRIEDGDTAARAAAADRCALLADTPAQRAQGLMNRTDLAGYDGMLFRFDEDTTGSFYMKDTPLPLSIAWFDADGAFVSSADMEPCLERPSCPTFAAAAPYRFALEVPRGGLPALGIGPGSRLIVGAASC